MSIARKKQDARALCTEPNRCEQPAASRKGFAAQNSVASTRGTAGPQRSTPNERTQDEITRWVQRLRQHIRSTYIESTRALVAAVDAKDPYTHAHSVTVASYAEAIGRQMELPARTIETVRAAALLHDIGKIGVPDAILTKPGPLDEAEFTLVMRHPEKALEILGHVSFLREERPLILHHHEHFDGTGYPAGLAGERIPLGARILAVADALETMLSARSYKGPYSMKQVRNELIAGAGSQFDPDVVDATLRWLDETEHTMPAATTCTVKSCGPGDVINNTPGT